MCLHNKKSGAENEKKKDSIWLEGWVSEECCRSAKEEIVGKKENFISVMF